MYFGVRVMYMLLTILGQVCTVTFHIKNSTVPACIVDMSRNHVETKLKTAAWLSRRKSSGTCVIWLNHEGSPHQNQRNTMLHEARLYFPYSEQKGN